MLFHLERQKKLRTGELYSWHKHLFRITKGDEMTTSRFTPSANEAALRRRLIQAIEDSGLSYLISNDHIVITPNGFTLGTFNLEEMSKFTNILEDIAEAAGTQFVSRRRSKSMQQSMQAPVRIPIDFKPAKVIRYAKESF